MPFQNRVDPYGQLHAVCARGAWLGNRGLIHDERQRIVRPWRVRRWLICTLRFKDRRRAVFTPGLYTELFFLDEATALAAGHRPCAECQRERYHAFRAHWIATQPRLAPGARVRVDDVDAVLHAERLADDGTKRRYVAAFGSLPSGTMIDLDGRPHLVHGGRAWPWSFTGYAAPLPPMPDGTDVHVLTPPSTLRVLRAGFVPQVHDSARPDGPPPPL